MAYTTIDDPSAHFQVITYSGSSDSTLAVTNDGNSDLQPDFVWIKNRNDTGNHSLVDSSRGVNKVIHSNATTAEADQDSRGYLSAFSSDGFTVSDGSTDGIDVKENAKTYVAWQWKANGGSATASASESGDNPAYSTQANTTAGFSIVTYTGTGANGTVTHSLGGTPEAIIIKNRDRVDDWATYWHKGYSNPQNYAFKFNSTASATAYDDDTAFNDTAPTSTVFSVGSANMTNTDGENIVAYCFRSIQGYSRIGSYVGNGETDGTFIYTGFKPAFVMMKNASTTGWWNINDIKRPGYNPTNDMLAAQSSNAEADEDAIDLLSNGFKQRSTGGDPNGNGETIIYMAFAEQPFVTSDDGGSIPCTAF